MKKEKITYEKQVSTRIFVTDTTGLTNIIYDGSFDCFLVV
jgi:hypothetical protein